MFLEGMVSTIGKTTQGNLDALRKQLGPGVDPAFDYSAFKVAQKSQDAKKAPHASKDPASPSGGSNNLDQLRRALREVVGTAGADEPDQDQAQAAAEAADGAKLSPGIIRKQREEKRPNRAFVTTTRNYHANLAVENRFRAPPVGSYRPNSELIDARVLGKDFHYRDPAQSRLVAKLEQEVAELKAEGKPYEHLYKDITSVEMLDEKPQRQKDPIHSPTIEKILPRPDIVKMYGISYQDNTFTDGVLEQDKNTSFLQRTPKWDFARMSSSKPKDREFYFQPGQYEPNLDAVRTKLETKNSPFEKQRDRASRNKKKPLPGDHLPDRSLARSCPHLSTSPRLLSPDISTYLDRPSINGKPKVWHNANDPEADSKVLDYQMNFDIMDAAKATWVVRPPGDFNKSLTRQKEMRRMRSYGSDVALQRVKDNITRGPVSVELLETDFDNSPSLKPRVRIRNMIHMAGREREHNYIESPARQKEQKGFKFDREVRTGESWADSSRLSPIAGVVSELRNTRTYDPLGATV